MIAHGFQELQDEMRRRFDEVDTRLDRMERKLSSTIDRVDDHDVRWGAWSRQGSSIQAFETAFRSARKFHLICEDSGGSES